MGRIVLHLTQMAKASPIKFIKWKPFNLRIQKQWPGTVSNPRKTASNSESTGQGAKWPKCCHWLGAGLWAQLPLPRRLQVLQCSLASPWGTQQVSKQRQETSLCSANQKGYLGRPKVIFQTVFEVKSSCAHFLFEHNHFKAEVRKPRVWAWFHFSFLLQSPPQSGYSFDIIMVLFLVTWGYYGTHYS